MLSAPLMSIRHVSWLICGLLALAGLALGYRTVVAPTEAVIIIEWTTASEVDTAGFNLYRSESPEGPFARINDHLIPASPDPILGGSYAFTDTEVVAGYTYYYQLEDVEINGTATRHGPIEAKAEGGGRMGMLLAIALLGGALLGAIGLSTLCRPPLRPR